MNAFLFKQIDNAALVVFRVFFGLLCALESFGAIATGWVKRTLIEPEFTFNFIGFEFLQPLPGDWMYVYYCIMGGFGVFIMLGYRYRLSTLVFAMLWMGTYFMQKTSYNNHYYLLFLLSFIMVVLPAHHYASLDVKRQPKLKSLTMPNWCRVVIIAQLFIVYTYASVAKLYPDWLDGSAVAVLMKSKSHFYIIGDLLQQKGFHYFIAYSGILFDGLIVPLLLFKPTRKYAFFGSIIFHIFNAVVFHIGIFPFLSLAFCLFFFEASTVRRLFLRKKPAYQGQAVVIPNYKNGIILGFGVYLIIQVALPLRHHFIEEDVLWTEEGHRLSWRMMLRSKSGSIRFKVVDTATNDVIRIPMRDYVTAKQKRRIATKPDFIWQFAQRLKQHFKAKGKSVAIYATAYVSINGKPRKQFIDPKVNLAQAEWNYFTHNNWILPSK